MSKQILIGCLDCKEYIAIGRIASAEDADGEFSMLYTSESDFISQWMVNHLYHNVRIELDNKSLFIDQGFCEKNAIENEKEHKESILRKLIRRLKNNF
jgi:hypothetical protein